MRQYQLAIVEDEPHTARYIQGIVEATNLFHIAAVCESAEELLTLEPGQTLSGAAWWQDASNIRGTELTQFTARGVYALLYQRDEPEVGQGSAGKLRWLPLRAARAMQERAAAIWDDQSVQGFLIAELIGDRAALPEGEAVILPATLSRGFLYPAAKLAVVCDTAIFGMGRSSEDGEGGGSNPLMAIVLAILAPIAASLIQFAISRSREYLADASGARYCGQPLALAAALGKLQSWNQRIPMQNGNPTTAEMFIVAPLFGGGMAKLFSTHPDINDRIARLREMAGVR